MTANDDHPDESNRQDGGGAFLELMLVAAFIALVVVAALGMVTKGLLTV
jgi:hypothetical protein